MYALPIPFLTYSTTVSFHAAAQTPRAFRGGGGGGAGVAAHGRPADGVAGRGGRLPQGVLGCISARVCVCVCRGVKRKHTPKPSIDHECLQGKKELPQLKAQGSSAGLGQRLRASLSRTLRCVVTHPARPTDRPIKTHTHTWREQKRVYPHTSRLGVVITPRWITIPHQSTHDAHPSTAP